MMPGYDEGGETAGVELSEPQCGRGKGPEGAGRWAESLCYTEADTILQLHTTCLGGFSHRSETAGGFTGRKHKLHYSDAHGEPVQRSSWQSEIDSWCCRSRFLKKFERPNLSRGGDYYNVMMAI